MSVSLDGKIALVTGSSRGIGRAIAERLAASGATVIINYTRGQQPAQALVNSILDRGGSAIAIQADISKPAEIGDCSAKPKRRWDLSTSLSPMRRSQKSSSSRTVA